MLQQPARSRLASAPTGRLAPRRSARARRTRSCIASQPAPHVAPHAGRAGLRKPSRRGTGTALPRFQTSGVSPWSLVAGRTDHERRPRDPTQNAIVQNVSATAMFWVGIPTSDTSASATIPPFRTANEGRSDDAVTLTSTNQPNDTVHRIHPRLRADRIRRVDAGSVLRVVPGKDKRASTLPE